MKILTLAALIFLLGCSTHQRSQARTASTLIAFGSCHHQDYPAPILKTILAVKPNLFLFTGDNVYPKNEQLESLEKAYISLQKSEDFLQLKKTVETYAVWDDHDYGINDGGAENPFKRQSQKLFLEHLGDGIKDPRHNREGLYRSIVKEFGSKRLQIIMLDTRYFRSPLKKTDRSKKGKERYVPDADPEKTLLGQAQWQWLESQLSQKADLRLIVSSIQLLPEDHGFEKWGNLPLERRRLLELIKKVPGVILISGDRHSGGIYKFTRNGAQPIYEVTSSGLNRIVPLHLRGEKDRLEYSPRFWSENFGFVEIDWYRSVVHMGLMDMSGSRVRTARMRIPEPKSDESGQ